MKPRSIQDVSTPYAGTLQQPLLLMPQTDACCHDMSMTLLHMWHGSLSWLNTPVYSVHCKIIPGKHSLHDHCGQRLGAVHRPLWV